MQDINEEYKFLTYNHEDDCLDDLLTVTTSLEG